MWSQVEYSDVCAGATRECSFYFKIVVKINKTLTFIPEKYFFKSISAIDHVPTLTAKEMQGCYVRCAFICLYVVIHI